MAVVAVIPHFFLEDPLSRARAHFAVVAQMIIRKRKKYEITATTALTAPAVDLRDGEGCHVVVRPGTDLGAWLWIRRDLWGPAGA